MLSVPTKINYNTIKHINTLLSNEYFGWYFDYDEDYEAYFLSIFDHNNFGEELYFLLDFDSNPIVTDAIRFKKDGTENSIKKSHMSYIDAIAIAKHIQKTFS